MRIPAGYILKWIGIWAGGFGFIYGLLRALFIFANSAVFNDISVIPPIGDYALPIIILIVSVLVFSLSIKLLKNK